MIVILYQTEADAQQIRRAERHQEIRARAHRRAGCAYVIDQQANPSADFFYFIQFYRI